MERPLAGIMERGTAIRLGATASAGLVALFGGALLAQYVLNSMKGKDKKTKIIEMVGDRSGKEGDHSASLPSL